MRLPEVLNRQRQFLPSQTYLLVFIVGFVCGIISVLVFQEIRTLESDVTVRVAKGTPVHSTIQFAQHVPFRKTVHGTDKQQLVEEFSVHPDLAGISMALILQGQTIQRHVHENMHEFFYVFEGEVDITVEYSPGRSITNQCPYGCFFHAVPGEPHEFSVRATAPNYAKMIVVQLTTSAGKVELMA